MFTRYIRLWAALGLLLLLGSCTEVIEIELDTTYRRLVVFGTVTSDSVRHRVDLSTSSDYFSNQPAPRVSGATVRLEFDGQLITLQELDTVPGAYLTPEAFRGTPHTTYRLQIENVDANGDGISEVYSAETTMPGGMQLDSIRPIYFKTPFVSGFQVAMYGLDPPTREWYAFKALKNGDLITDTLSKFTVQPDDFFNGTYIYGLPVMFLADDNPREASQQGDTVTFELNSIEKAYYDFIIDAQLEIFGNNPLFSGPSANVSSNIDSDGRGLFTSYFIQRISTTIPPASDR